MNKTTEWRDLQMFDVCVCVELMVVVVVLMDAWLNATKESIHSGFEHEDIDFFLQHKSAPLIRNKWT